jgi:hypothetical protein
MQFQLKLTGTTGSEYPAVVRALAHRLRGPS